MAGAETLVFQASFGKDVYRTFETADTSGLSVLAQVIVRSFDFDFDPAFGFYGKLKGNIYDMNCLSIWERARAKREVLSARALSKHSRRSGPRLRFRFDYGDEWEFPIELVKRKPKEPKVKLPRLLISAGEAPVQYPDPEDE